MSFKHDVVCKDCNWAGVVFDLQKDEDGSSCICPKCHSTNIEETVKNKEKYSE
ncbi:hypothetical protein HN682_06135 [Candidatus Peregrinibacteria bacterium]|jgi:hypothetical protein|nr:hypothetical protein [Candidatus Peregrinibacteria bacterium]